ncbi:MAG: hypothetical protein NUV69_02040 [Candidatus Curtissbacteria bacterium]|nr:hypothetical protein [Candidatus Curtissbacteria bacterium]
MGIQETIRNIPEMVKRELRADSYEEFLDFLSSNPPNKVSAVTNSKYLNPRTPEERRELKEENIGRFQYALKLRATGINGRRISYWHLCDVMRASHPDSRTGRTAVLPDIDIRGVVKQRFVDAQDRTLATACYLLHDVDQTMPGAQLVLTHNNQTLRGDKIRGQREILERNRVRPWPNTPGVEN